MLMGGVARSLQIAGSLESMLEISVRYSNERVAFEKKISKFQAVQHNLAKLAGESAAALAAATSAADAMANATSFNDEVFLEAVSAKIRCSEAAEKGGGDRPSGAWRDRLHHRAHPASLYRCARWRGATISAPRATGRSNSASSSPPAAPMNCGRWWPRADRSGICLHKVEI